MRLSLLLLCLAAGNCGTSPNKEPVTRHQLQGVIRNVDTSAKTVTVSHKKVPGFMDAMTMEYPVRDGRELAGLRKGEMIDGVVFVQDTDFWLGEIKERK